MKEPIKSPDPELLVLEGISSRLTRGADFANRMRVEMYVMDVVRSAQNAGDKDIQTLLEEVKEGEGFSNLTTTMHVPDETTLSLLNEAKERLAMFGLNQS